ncbi:hypothetical protein BJ165DRAFT_1446010, partial [Panaeolus papilionaceus]
MIRPDTATTANRWSRLILFLLPILQNCIYLTLYACFTRRVANRCLRSSCISHKSIFRAIQIERGRKRALQFATQPPAIQNPCRMPTIWRRCDEQAGFVNIGRGFVLDM